MQKRCKGANWVKQREHDIFIEYNISITLWDSDGEEIIESFAI